MARSLHSWLTPSRAARRPLPRRLRMERLEDRETPATFVWDGRPDSGPPSASPDNLFSDPLNWVGDVAPPTDGSADLAFRPGAARLTASNDFTGALFGSIAVFGGYVITGNAVGLNAAGLTVNYATNGEIDVIGLPLNFRDSALNVAVTTSAGNSNLTGGTLQLNGAITTTSGSVLGFTVNAGLVAAQGVIGGPGGLTKAGTGEVQLSGQNTYAGSTIITGGVLSITSDASLGAVPPTPTPNSIQIDNGGTLEAFRDLTLNANRGIAVRPPSGAGAGAIRVSDSATLTYDGVIANNTVNGPPAGVGTLVKTGGKLILGGNNSFDGQTIVRISVGGGLLIVNGQYLGEIALDGGSLGGTGQVRDVIATNNGGAISPGTGEPTTGTTSPGRLTALGAGLAFNSHVTYVAELGGTVAGTTYDQLFLATGGLNLGGATLRVKTGFNPLPVDSTFDVIVSAVPTTGTFAGVPEGANFITPAVPTGFPVPPEAFVFRVNYNVPVPNPSGGSPLFATRLTRIILPPPPSSLPFFAVGAGAGGGPHVKVVNADGSTRSSFFAYDPAFTGGVFVAGGDVNGDGVADVITGAGAGAGPRVKVFSGKDGSLLYSFMAYNPAFKGGVRVAAGDVNADGKADIITGAGPGGGPHVEVFSGADGHLIRQFYAYVPNFAGGVFVAAADMNSDGKADVITGAGAGGGPHVKVFSVADLAVLRSFYAYDPKFAGGVSVTAGDVNGDGFADIITGAGAGGGPHVKVFDGKYPGDLDASFFAYDPAFTGGVFVAARDVNGDGKAEIVTGSGAGGGPSVKVFDGTSRATLDSFMAYDPAFLGGVHVG